MADTSKATGLVVTLLAFSLASGCHPAYRPPAYVDEDNGAIVITHLARLPERDTRLQMAIRVFEATCGDSRYLGVVDMSAGTDQRIVVPARGLVAIYGSRIFHNFLFHSDCTAHLAFRPEAGKKYVVLFDSRAAGVHPHFGQLIGHSCGIGIVEATGKRDEDLKFAANVKTYPECTMAGTDKRSGWDEPRQH